MRLKRRWPLMAVAGACLLGALAFVGWQRPEPSDAPAEPAGASFPWAATPVPRQTAGSAATASAATAPVVTAAAAPPSAGAFRTDAQGELVVDSALRLRAEELLALHEGPDLAARLDAELATLPPAAAVRARDLVTRLDGYQAAQRAAFPPGEAPLVPEEGLAQLDAMQALRVSHFGAEAAQRLFGEDDAVARRLLQLMRDETDASLSMEQKAMRAQARYDLERGTAQR
jgi:lipase chaperone LimK